MPTEEPDLVPDESPPAALEAGGSVAADGPTDPAPPAAEAPQPRRTLADRLPRWLREHLGLLAADTLTLYATLAAAVVLTVSRYHVSTSEYHRLETPDIVGKGGLYAAALHGLHLPGLAGFVEKCTAPVADYVYWFTGSLVLFFVVPLLAARPFRLRPADLGVGFGDWRYGLKATALLYAVMLPFVVGASFSSAFNGHYPMCGGAVTSWRSLGTYEAAYASYFIGWEFVYRGLLCAALYPRLGAPVILLHTIPFAVMHAGKPEPEAYGSIIAGLALGAVAVRARSFWYGALLHAGVAFTMDALALLQTHRFPSSW